MFNAIFNNISVVISFISGGNLRPVASHRKTLSVTCDRSLVFTRYSGFLHQLNWKIDNIDNGP